VNGDDDVEQEDARHKKALDDLKAEASSPVPTPKAGVSIVINNPKRVSTSREAKLKRGLNPG